MSYDSINAHDSAEITYKFTFCMLSDRVAPSNYFELLILKFHGNRKKTIIIIGS